MYILLLLIAAIIAAPFLWGISSAFKDTEGVYAATPAWIPSPAIWDNFVAAWTTLPLGNFFINSLKVAGLITAGQLITCSLAAYAFARLRFPGRDLLFGVYLS